MKQEAPDDWSALVDGYLAGTLDDEDFARLKEGLREDAECRDAYLAAVEMDTLLREIAGQRGTVAQETIKPVHRRHLPWFAISAAAACLIAIAVIVATLSSGGEARIRELSGVTWLSEARRAGQSLESGDMLELTSGSVEIEFRSGALTRLHGPAHFEITSANGGFLHHGEAWSRADTPQSDGFSIRTRSAHFIDRGTEFLTTARRDGFSQMHVSSGTVDVEVDGFARQRFEEGSGLGIEPGEQPVMIRIESGDETDAFTFPTIPPPTTSDWADRRQQRSEVELISVDRKERPDLTNAPAPPSGNPGRLIDGVGQTGADQPGESLFLPNGATGMILLDLGSDVPVASVHTYSWHLNDDHPEMRRRAVQRYTLWAAAGTRPETMPSEDDPGSWIRIARVDTDAFFKVEQEPDRPAQQACAIKSSAPSIGRFRYLLFQVVPTPMPDGSPARHTFFGEIDVFIAPGG